MTDEELPMTEEERNIEDNTNSIFSSNIGIANN